MNFARCFAACCRCAPRSRQVSVLEAEAPEEIPLKAIPNEAEEDIENPSQAEFSPSSSSSSSSSSEDSVASTDFRSPPVSLDYGELPASAYSFSLDSLAWQRLPSSPSAPLPFFYSNCVTGASCWEKPRDFIEFSSDVADRPAFLADFPDLRDFCQAVGVSLNIFTADYRDPYFPSISAEPPLFLEVLFYSHLLRAELSLYPPTFVSKTFPGLSIFLCSGLSYQGQQRLAIPNPHSPILYLNCCLANFHFLRSVFHHEFFHLLDYKIAQRRQSDEEKREKEENTSKTPHSKGNVKKRLDISNLPDPGWLLLNSSLKGFSYGEGGWKARGNHLAITQLGKTKRKKKNSHNSMRNGELDDEFSDASDDSIFIEFPGFLNEYSLSAPEEDRAEIFAGMMKNTREMREIEEEEEIIEDDEFSNVSLHHSILRLKCRELKNRLFSLDSAWEIPWWEKIEQNSHNRNENWKIFMNFRETGKSGKS